MAKKNTRKSHRIIQILLGIITVFLISIVSYIMVMRIQNKVPMFFGRSIFTIVSSSMESTIPKDSTIVIENISPNDVKVDDIITFYSQDADIKDMPNTHRVIDIIQKNGKIFYQTKGDNNSVADENLVSQDDIIGKFVKISHIFTTINSFIPSSFGYILLIIIPALLLFIFGIVDLVKIVKGKE